MSITIQPVTIDSFTQTQENYKTSNFLQSSQMASIQQKRKRFNSVTLGIFDNGELIGQCLVLYRKKARLFKEAIILHGPLLDYSNIQLLERVLPKLKNYFKQEGVAYLSIHPYLTNNILTTNLEVKHEKLAQRVIDCFTSFGFTHFIDTKQTIVANQIFTKELKSFHSIADIEKTYSHALRKELKKIRSTHIKIKELKIDELSEFYNIVKSTGERKDFALQEFDYFKLLKEYFNEKAVYLLAYLDCKEYTTSLKEQIAGHQQTLDELSAKEQTKKVKGAILDTTAKLNSAVNRLTNFENLSISQESLPLSSILFIIYGNEVVSFVGGNYEQYLNFGGATLLNSSMITYAFENHFERYNFYGTIETDQAQSGSGNFKFKRQFNGQLEQFVGGFTVYLNPLLKIINQFKQ
ncbi:peptidoglycan bridge formation glycyltransferase FemA/FemB family protein [Streptococcus suis]|nr:peptidoglycan bridge formation glycyltransferase FemA/FemB family protein [Streptococcus suis]